MTMLEKLSDAACWESFYRYKCSLACTKQFTRELRDFIDSKAYLPVCEGIAEGRSFALPRRAVISKLDTGKKRVIYTYPSAENTVLKLLTYLMLRKYDGLFSEGLYSFRPSRTAQQAFKQLARTPGIGKMYSYKADISNYFNSVDIPLLLPMLEAVTADDPRLFEFLRSLLCEPMVLERGRPIRDDKGIMAGTPLSAFYANLFLTELDRHFAETGIPYARYSDDIILFAPTRAEAEAHAGYIRSFLAGKRLVLNPDKEHFAAPEEGWVFLGLNYSAGTVDIAPASVTKLKAKMRRKTRALMRWQQRGGAEPERSAKAFIRIFNRKLFEAASDNDLTWSRWYFPTINTDRSLKEIDSYAQECLRYLISGKRTKERYNVRYDTLKALGYRTLVNEYYGSKPAGGVNG